MNIIANVRFIVIHTISNSKFKCLNLPLSINNIVTLVVTDFGSQHFQITLVLYICVKLFL